MDTKRTKNFTVKEKDLIINLVLKYKCIIENKKTDALSLDAKKNAWETLTEEYNANSSYKRSLKQIKAFYKNSKTSLKKDIAADRIEIYKTGGGSFQRKVNNNNPLLAIVGRETTSITNNYDSSCDYVANVEPECDDCNDPDCDAIDINDTPLMDDENLNSDGNSIHCENLGTTPYSAVTNKVKRAYSRKRKSNHEIRIYMETLADLKKQKLEAQIEKNKAKTRMYEKKMIILDALERDLNKSQG